MKIFKIRLPSSLKLKLSKRKSSTDIEVGEAS